jgi:peptide deformylase
VALASSPIPSMTSSVKWMTRIRSVLLLLQVKWMTLKTRLFRKRPPEFLVHPHSTLAKRAEEIDFTKTSRKELVKIVRKMGAALSSTGYGDKLGIAAPQIGISKRIMVVLGVVMVNPTWKPSKAPPEKVVEGCYSVPHKVYEVERAPYGWASWVSIDGTPRHFKLNGLQAIVFQHEFDHLEGRCCADVGKLLREDNSNKMAKYKILEDVVISGIEYKKGQITELDYTRANLNSLKGKIEAFDPNKVEETPAPAPVTEPEKAPEAPVEVTPATEPEAPVASTPEAAKAAEDAANSGEAVAPTPSPVTTSADVVPEGEVPEGSVPPANVPLD